MASQSRLREIARHVVTSAKGGRAVDLPLARQDYGTGTLTPDSVDELTREMSSAAGRLDFQTAAQLQSMLSVLAPRGGEDGAVQLSLATFTSDDADHAADLLLQHGFCVLPSVVSEPELQAMRQTYEPIAAQLAAEYEERCAAGASHARGPLRTDVGRSYNFPAEDTVFSALLDPPLLMQVVHRVLGQPALVQGDEGVVLPVGMRWRHYPSAAIVINQ